MKTKVKRISIVLALCMLCSVMFGVFAASAQTAPSVSAGDSMRYVTMTAYKGSNGNACIDIQVNYTNYPDYFDGSEQLAMNTNGAETRLVSATTFFADGQRLESSETGNMAYYWNFNITNFTVDHTYAPVYSFQATIEFTSIDPNATQNVTFSIAGLSRTISFIPSAL